MTGKALPANGVLIITTEVGHGERLANAVRRCKLTPRQCGTLDQARRILSRERFTAVLCEETSNALDFRAEIVQLERLAHRTPVIAVSRHDDWLSYMRALDAGAADYLAFPPYAGEVERSLRKASEAARAVEDAA